MPEISSSPILKVDNLSVVLASDAGCLRALDGVHFSLARGETFALVGESGCGKTMTALALMRLLPDCARIVDGAVQLLGEDLLALPEAQMRKRRGKRIGMIFQDAATSLNPVIPIGAQLIEAIVTHTPLQRAQAYAKALEWLQRVEIPEPQERMAAYPFQLSGGQKQRVMIALALAAEPDILIADEPTTALDVTIQAQILSLLKNLQRELGMAILLITHDLAIVANIAHQVALMYAGQIIELASAADFFAQPLHPYAHQLLATLPHAQQRQQMLATIPGIVPSLTQHFTGCRFAARCAKVMADCHEIPPLLHEPIPGRTVRCLLYAQGVAFPQFSRASRAIISATPRQENTPPILAIKNLRVYFPVRRGVLQRTVDHVKAVDDVCFDLQSGRTLALVGESGCGKTSIAKALLQLLHGQARVSGTIALHGQMLDHLSGKELRRVRRQMQIVFQDPYASLNPRMRIHEILQEGMIALRPEMNAKQRQAQILGLLDQVGLDSGALLRYPHEFSGGQRQRLALVRALAVEPQIIICDEPTSALDVSVQAQILNLLKGLQRELNVAYLFISHNLAVVDYLAHEVAVMRRGVIVEQGPVEQVLHTPHHPYTQQLLAALPRF